MISPQEIARSALAEVQAHEEEYNDAYWLGYVLATLQRIADD
jgi:hypothetical protein